MAGHATTESRGRTNPKEFDHQLYILLDAVTRLNSEYGWDLLLPRHIRIDALDIRCSEDNSQPPPVTPETLHHEIQTTEYLRRAPRNAWGCPVVDGDCYIWARHFRHVMGELIEKEQLNFHPTQ